MASLVERWEQIGRSLAEQKAVEASNSNEARECGRLAAEIVRTAQELGLDIRELGRRSTECALMAAAAEAGRTLLSSAAKRTTLSATACFEADGKGNYRFINNRITIVHPTLGKFEFLATSAVAIDFLGSELGLEIKLESQIPEGPAVFKTSVVLDAGPNKDRVFQGIQIQFYKRDGSGVLANYQPGDWQLQLETST